MKSSSAGVHNVYSQLIPMLSTFRKWQLRESNPELWVDLLWDGNSEYPVPEQLIWISSINSEYVHLDHQWTTCDVWFLWHWLVRLVFTSLWCCLDLDCEVMRVWQRPQIKCSQTAGLTRENEQLLLSQCFLYTWRWKVSVSWPEVSSAGENPTREICKCLMNTITLITLCCITVWLQLKCFFMLIGCLKYLFDVCWYKYSPDIVKRLNYIYIIKIYMYDC